DILIFDEATSHLDTATERAIQENLKKALAGKTVVLVAHRLSTVKDADRIYVLHQGTIVQEGTHQQLLAEEVWYRVLGRFQTGDSAERGAPRAERKARSAERNGAALCALGCARCGSEGNGHA